MMNVSTGQLVFNVTDRRLNDLVRDALHKAACAIARMYDLEC